MGVKYLLLVPLFLLLFSGCIMDQPYENRFKGFSTIQPGGWNAYESELSVVFSPAEKKNAQITVLVAYSDTNVTNENLAYAYKARLVSALTGVSILNESGGEIIVGGEPAFTQNLILQYDLGENASYLFSKAVFLKKERRYFIISFVYPSPDPDPAQFAEYERIFEKMLANFRIFS